MENPIIPVPFTGGRFDLRNSQEFASLRPFGARSSTEPAVVCFPHSGGSAESFRRLTACAATGLQWWAVQYPGRGDRSGEPPATSIDAIVRTVAAEIERMAPEVAGIVLFGHSFGALVAYETAVALTEAGAPPDFLFVSASPSPWYAAGGEVHLSDDEKLWATACALGGIDSELAGDEEFRDLLLPILRADITANETYRPRARTPLLRCPIRCYYSPEDLLCQENTMRAWSSATSAAFDIRARDGGHFHLFADPAGLVHDMAAALTGIRA